MYRESFFPDYSVHHGRLTLTVYANSLSYKPAVTISLTDGSQDPISETITFEFLDTLIEQVKFLHEQFCQGDEYDNAKQLSKEEPTTPENN